MTAAGESSFSKFIKGNLFSNLILIVVFFNAIVIGCQSFPNFDSSFVEVLAVLDLICLGIFTLELVLKLIFLRADYFKDGWNIFDFIIVALSLIFINSSFISMLRILRVLRVLKSISYIKSLRRVTTSLFMAVPTIASVALLLSIVLFIFGVIGYTLYAEVSPKYFGDLAKSLVTLFQIATFDDWANIYRPIAEETAFSIVYFTAYILVVVFIILNLVVGEIVNNAAKLSEEEQADAEKSEEKDQALQISELRTEIRELKLLLQNKRYEEEDAS